MRIGASTGPGASGAHRHNGSSSRRQWVAVTALAVAITATAIAVPPLISRWSNGAAPASAAAASPTQVAPPTQTPPPTGTAASPTAPAGSPSPAKNSPFPAIRIPATSQDNEITGGAAPVACPTCTSGSRVRYIGVSSGVVIKVRGVPAPGQRTLTVFYESDGPRAFFISVNNGPPVVRNLSGKGDWVTPATTTLTVTLPAGDSTIKFNNPNGVAPDLDEVVIG